MAQSSHAERVSPATMRALATSSRLSAVRQRRLSRLMDKSGEAPLSAKESAELESMLDEVDRKSFWMLARVLVKKRTDVGRQSTAKR